MAAVRRPERGLDDVGREQLLYSLARSIASRGLRTPALLAIDLLRPLGIVGSHLYLLVEPLLASDARHKGRAYAALLEERGNLDDLQSILESL